MPQQYYVKDFTMKMHMNMDKCGILQHAGTIICPTNERIHKKEITRVVTTPKKRGMWGVGVATFHVAGDEAEYSSIDELNKKYDLELVAEDSVNWIIN